MNGARSDRQIYIVKCDDSGEGLDDSLSFKQRHNDKKVVLDA